MKQQPALESIEGAVFGMIIDSILAANPIRLCDESCMIVFEHEKLEVYCVAVEYADAAERIAARLESGNAHIRDQLRRASDSVVNNTAEGAGEFAPAEKARFYRIALRSGTESAATLHTCSRRSLADQTEIESARVLLKRVVEMLTRLILSVSQR